MWLRGSKDTWVKNIVAVEITRAEFLTSRSFSSGTKEYDLQVDETGRENWQVEITQDE